VRARTVASVQEAEAMMAINPLTEETSISASGIESPPAPIKSAIPLYDNNSDKACIHFSHEHISLFHFTS
jgi:hypothetical protein